VWLVGMFSERNVQADDRRGGEDDFHCVDIQTPHWGSAEESIGTCEGMQSYSSLAGSILNKPVDCYCICEFGICPRKILLVFSARRSRYSFSSYASGTKNLA
jgi:hypothetical protein